MNEDIPIRYRWTADELLNGYRWHFRHRFRPGLRWTVWIIAALSLIGGTVQVWQSRSLFPNSLFFFAVIFGLFWIFVIRPWLVRRQFARRPDRDSEVEWRISSDSIHARNAHGSSDFTWSALAKIVQTPAGFLFYPTEQIFHWLPRHGFANDADFDRLSQLVQQHATAFHRCAY